MNAPRDRTAASAEPGVRRAIVIDPDAATRNFVARALASFRPGFDVRTAESTVDARRWLETIGDAELVVVADEEHVATRAMLASRTCASTRLVRLASGAGTGPSDERTEDDVALRKPFSLTELLRAVRAARPAAEAARIAR